MLGVVGVQAPAQGRNEDRQEEKDADDDMEGMKTYQRVQCRAKGI